MTYESEFGTEAADFVRNEFYIDDGLKSVATDAEAIELIQKTTEMCKGSGLRLHKFISNSDRVLDSLDQRDRASSVKELDFNKDGAKIERPLGIQWNVESDTIQYCVSLKEKPFTRRGILSTVSSIYDPLGFVSPFTLKGKQILQDLCRENLGWDEEIPREYRIRWETWKAQVPFLSNFSVDRCVKPKDFGKVVTSEVHHFSDASTNGYGQVSYLRQIDESGRVHVSFIMGKSRVVPLKQISVPRLELTAALVSARVSQFLNRELQCDVKNIYWTDSKVVLGYINNDSKRFHTFVANRVQEIRNISAVDQWNYVPSKENPADFASRGMHAQELVSESLWLRGPNFLWDPSFTNEDKQKETNVPLDLNDPEVKKCQSFSSVSSATSGLDLSRFEHIASWYRLKRAVAICLKFGKALKNKAAGLSHRNDQKSLYDSITVTDMRDAENKIVQLAQNSPSKRSWRHYRHRMPT